VDDDSTTRRFVEYAKNLGVSLDDLSSALTAGCYRDELVAVREGGCIYQPCARGGKASLNSTHKNLDRAGVLRDVHRGLRADNVDWRRVDELLSIRERIK